MTHRLVQDIFNYLETFRTYVFNLAVDEVLPIHEELLAPSSKYPLLQDFAQAFNGIQLLPKHLQ